MKLISGTGAAGEAGSPSGSSSELSACRSPRRALHQIRTPAVAARSPKFYYRFPGPWRWLARFEISVLPASNAGTTYGKIGKWPGK